MLDVARAAGHTIDVVRVGDPGCPALSSTDEVIVRWAAEHGRVLISRDARTLESAVVEFTDAGGTSAGLGLLRRGMTVPELSEMLLLIALATEEQEWQNVIQWFP